jgi:hypothetical protein
MLLTGNQPTGEQVDVNLEGQYQPSPKPSGRTEPLGGLPDEVVEHR